MHANKSQWLTIAKWSLTILVIVALLAFIVLKQMPFIYPEKPEHAWFKKPSRSELDLRWRDLDQEYVIPVDSDKLQEASIYLESTSFVEIDSHTVQHLTGSIKNDWKEKKAILCRGLEVEAASGRFVVSEVNNLFWVRFGCLGAGPFQLVEHPLIIFTSKSPVDVYVSVSIAR